MDDDYILTIMERAKKKEPARSDGRAADIQTLKSRWEFSSSTGTPLHPDETEDDLMRAAKRLWESTLPKAKKKKSLEQPQKDSSDDDDARAEQQTESDNEPNYSIVIDDAFHFMQGSPAKTPSRSAQLHFSEQPSPHDAILKEVVENKPSEQQGDDGNDSKIGNLQYTISFYRKLTKEKTSAPPITLDSTREPAVSVDELKKKLRNIMYAQEMKVQQASKALQLCQNKEQFRGSHEEATAQWAVLIETEMGRAASEELARLEKEGVRCSNNHLGQLTLSYILVELNWESLFNSDELFYFCIILRSAEKVLHTAIVSSEVAFKRGGIEVTQPMTLDGLCIDFTASLEFYAFRTIRGQYTHEEKFGLSRQQKGGSTTKYKGSRHRSRSTTSSDSCFHLVGRLLIDRHLLDGKKELQLSDVRHPLYGDITIKMNKQLL